MKFTDMHTYMRRLISDLALGLGFSPRYEQGQGLLYVEGQAFNPAAGAGVTQ
jgi:hypothetical protein